MIIVKLIGGIGNQMFQYAAGLRLAEYHNTDLFIDVSGFTSTDSLKYTLRKYELGNFKITASIVPTDILKYVSPASKWFRKSLNKFGITYVKQKSRIDYITGMFGITPSLNFQKEILLLPDNIYLDGYWQDERYFIDIEDIIRGEFLFKHPPSDINQDIMNKINDCNSVSIHVRRGDYITDLETRRHMYVCDEKYYKQSIIEIMHRVEKPSFFIFSDDIEWAKQHVIPDAPTMHISHNSVDNGFEDLQLMIQCHHHIISNSSFSWWGAWLGKKYDQVVIAPKNWFAIRKYLEDYKIPDNWVKI